MTHRISWRKKKPEGLGFRAPSHILHYGGKELAHAQLLPSGKWFWYGMDHNTCATPDTLENVKKEAIKVAREWLKTHGDK